MDGADKIEVTAGLKEVRRLAAAGQIQKARAILAEVVRAEPPGASMFLAVGDAYAAIDDSQQARMFWRAAATRGAAVPGMQGKARKRLAMDASRRARMDEAIAHMERYLEDRPDDASNALRLLFWKLARVAPQERARVLQDCRDRYPSLRDGLLDLIVVLPFSDPPRAAQVLTGRVAELAAQRDLAIAAVDSLIEAGQPAAARTIAEYLFAAEGAAGKELNCLLRADRAAGGEPEASLAFYETHLGRYPHDHENRLKKAKLLLQLRRWQPVVNEGRLVLKDKPGSIPAALIVIQALVRLDRPDEAREVRDAMVALHTRLNPDNAAALVPLDLALADAAAALERGNAAAEDTGDQGSEQAARIDAFMATGAHAQAMDLLTTAIHASDDLTLRAKAIQCAAALRLADDPETRFPEGAFRMALARRPVVSGPRDSVVLVTSTLGAGGAERQIAMTAARCAPKLAEYGLKTRLVCRDLRPQYGNATMLPMLDGSDVDIVDLTWRDAGMAVRDMRAGGMLGPEDIRLLSAFPLSLYRAIIVLYEQFRRLSPRVVHLWQDGIIMAGGVAAVLAGVPKIVASIRNLVPLENDTRRARPYLGAVYRMLAERPDVAMAANSEMGARDYEAKFGLRPNSIGVIRNGLDVDAVLARRGEDGRASVRRELGIADGVPVIGGVFRLVPAKRPQRWLEVAARISQDIPNLRMVICGEGPLRGALEAQAESLGMADRLHLVGRKSPVEPWIAAMDTMLLASDIEGLPNVLIEAQALGVPVVTTDAGGTREAVDAGVTGTVAAEDRIEDLAKACLFHLTSEADRIRVFHEGPRFIRSRFGVDRMVSETLDIFGVRS